MNAPWAWVELRTASVDDATGTVTAEVVHDEVVVGTLRYVAWGDTLSVVGLDLDDDAPASVLPAVIRALSDRVLSDGFATYYHYEVHDPAVVAHYLDGPLGPAMVAIGVVRQQVAYFDPLSVLSPDAPDHLHVTLYHDAALRKVSEATLPSDPYARLQVGPSLVRIAVLRATVSRGDFDADVTDALLRYALLDAGWDVRQFAAVSLNGALGPRELVADVPELVAHLRDPLRSLAPGVPLPVMPAGLAFDPAHARRNKRFALLFVLGTRMAWTFPTEADRLALRGALDPILADDASAWTPGADAEIREAALADAAVDVGLAVGRLDDLGLFGLCRYVLLRHRAWVAAHPDDPDPFDWLVDQVTYLVPSPRAPRPVDGDPCPAVAAALYRD